MAIGQAVELIDQGVLFSRRDNAETKDRLVIQLIKNSLKSHPKTISSTALLNDFTILHISRDGHGDKSQFRVWEHHWRFNRGWRRSVEKQLPSTSEVIIAAGTGEPAFTKWHQKWKREIGQTSRAVFSAFCDSLQEASDPYTGGAPQLGGLFRTGFAKQFGIIFDQERYIAGLKTDKGRQLAKIDWFNELFERCSPDTMHIKQGAQRQPRPLGIPDPRL